MPSLLSDLAPLDNKIIARLLSVANQCLSSSDSQRIDLLSELFHLITTADEALRNSEKNKGIQFSLRTLYCECSLIWSLMHCLDISRDSDNELSWKKVIARLDYAIVVAGAPGDRRLDLILNTISIIQRDHFPSSHSSYIEYDETLVTSICPTQGFVSSSREVTRMVAPPPLLTFQSQYAHEPLLFHGFASDWPAIEDRKWYSVNYLRKVAGRGRVIPVEVGNDYRTDDWSQKMMDWDDFLDYITSSASRTETLYLAQHDLFKQFPLLRSDICIPDYVYAELAAPDSFASYRPLSTEDGYVTNVWFGPEGAISPAHTVSTQDASQTISYCAQGPIF